MPDAATVVGEPLVRRVPPSAVVISFGALAVALVGSLLAPGAMEEQYALLIWLPALVPAFLLTYHRGWSGASYALAAGMATLALSQAALSWMRAEPPPWQFLLVLVAVWVGIGLGLGWVGELLHQQRRKAEALALRDPLTGLANRGHLGLFLDTAFGGAERGGHLTVVLFDLDRFKRINDVHGHAAGDETLVAFAEILRTHTRRSDFSGRFGGEEFVSVLTGSGGPAGARVFAERVRDELRALPLPWGPVTASAGIAAYQPGMGSPDLVLAEADRALYRAKEDGRDRVVVAAQGVAAGAQPREERPAPVPADGASEGRPRLRRGPRVLVVDDDEIMMEGVSRILRRAGFQTAKARDGVEALETLERGEAPDLVLAGVVMPRMGGLAMADRIAEERPGVRVLLVSGYEHGHELPNLPRQVVGLLQKPLTPGGLVEAVRVALSQPFPAGRTAPGDASDLPSAAAASGEG